MPGSTPIKAAGRESVNGEIRTEAYIQLAALPSENIAFTNEARKRLIKIMLKSDFA